MQVKSIDSVDTHPPVPVCVWMLITQQRTKQAWYLWPSYSSNGRYSLHKFKMLQGKVKLNKMLEGMGGKARLFRCVGREGLCCEMTLK